MQPQQSNKKPKQPSQRSFKTSLAKSGYSEDAADKIWKWYSTRIVKRSETSAKAT
ncbi:MAG TPA: hypothetical protein VJY36_02205 [Candidatus Bathyarchaeia archaeon]|nr:hypothetical protein [Candidatus Bathyarchaeia archaeon]